MISAKPNRNAQESDGYPLRDNASAIPFVSKPQWLTLAQYLDYIWLTNPISCGESKLQANKTRLEIVRTRLVFANEESIN